MAVFNKMYVQYRLESYMNACFYVYPLISVHTPDKLCAFGRLSLCSFGPKHQKMSLLSGKPVSHEDDKTVQRCSRCSLRHRCSWS